MQNLNDAFDKVQKAASVAINRAVRAGNGETDPELLAYSNLNKDAFNALINKYGAENVIQYIREMEMRKIKNGNAT